MFTTIQNAPSYQVTSSSIKLYINPVGPSPLFNNTVSSNVIHVKNNTWNVKTQVLLPMADEFRRIQISFIFKDHYGNNIYTTNKSATYDSGYVSRGSNFMFTPGSDLTFNIDFGENVVNYNNIERVVISVHFIFRRSWGTLNTWSKEMTFVNIPSIPHLITFVRGETPDVFGLPDTRASVVRNFSGGLLFAGGDNGGKLFHVPDVDGIGNNSVTTELGQLIPLAEIKMDARYGIYDLTILEDTPTSARFMYSYPRRTNEDKLQVVFKEATIELDTFQKWTLKTGSIINRYESQPPVATDGAHHGSGKMARIDANSVYVSVGDMGSGIISTRLEYPGSEGDLGHILKLTMNGSTVTRADVSKGHRNIQGIVYASGRLIATEHGPKGGDEINVINLQEVKDYGWPYVTLGDPYDTNITDDPRNYATIGQTQTHEGYEKPIYSWTPSIAPTEIIYLSDLDMYVMGTLREKTIFVFKITNTNRVSTPFAIPVNLRIRSLTVSGTSVIGSSDEGAIVVLPKDVLPKDVLPKVVNVSVDEMLRIENIKEISESNRVISLPPGEHKITQSFIYNTGKNTILFDISGNGVSIIKSEITDKKIQRVIY